MTEFMKTSKNCGVAVNKGCFSSGKVYTLNNTVYDENTNDSYSHMYKIITADGMSVAFYATSNYIHVDIDGPNKGKNKMGDDRFTFFIDGMIKKDLVLKPLAIESTRTGAFNKNYDVYIWAIENDNMDYLKCADKLNWQNQTTCK